MAEAKAQKSIMVKALRDGYYDNEIKREGRKFEIKSEQELGSWMHRLDGGVNPHKDKHLKVSKVVADKAFKALDESKLIADNKIKKKAEKEVAQAHKDAEPKDEVKSEEAYIEHGDEDQEDNTEGLI